MAQAKTNKENTSSNALMLLVTIVDRRKAEFYTDLIQSLGANVSFTAFGEGTADAKMMNLMGFTNSEKAVLFSVIRKDRQKEILETIEDKFKSIKNGKGVCVTIPFTSVIGVNLFNFLSDNRMTLM